MIHPHTSSSVFVPELNQDQIQPNGIDLCVAKVFKRKPEIYKFVLSKEKNKCRQIHIYEIPSVYQHDLGDYGWNLNVGYYIIEMKEKVSIGDTEAGFVLPRSSLIRNGVMLSTGLYDSGYSGSMRHAMNIVDTNFILGKDVRIAQFILFNAEAISQYDGQYQEKIT